MPHIDESYPQAMLTIKCGQGFNVGDTTRAIYSIEQEKKIGDTKSRGVHWQKS
jgi:hypothetical protein